MIISNDNSRIQTNQLKKLDKCTSYE